MVPLTASAASSRVASPMHYLPRRLKHLIAHRKRSLLVHLYSFNSLTESTDIQERTIGRTLLSSLLAGYSSQSVCCAGRDSICKA